MRSLVMSRKKTPGSLAEIDLFFLWLQKRLVKPWIAFWLQDWKLRMITLGVRWIFVDSFYPKGRPIFQELQEFSKLCDFWWHVRWVWLHKWIYVPIALTHFRRKKNVVKFCATMAEPRHLAHEVELSHDPDPNTLQTIKPWRPNTGSTVTRHRYLVGLHRKYLLMCTKPLQYNWAHHGLWFSFSGIQSAAPHLWSWCSSASACALAIPYDTILDIYTIKFNMKSQNDDFPKAVFSISKIPFSFSNCGNQMNHDVIHFWQFSLWQRFFTRNSQTWGNVLHSYGFPARWWVPHTCMPQVWGRCAGIWDHVWNIWTPL